MSDMREVFGPLTTTSNDMSKFVCNAEETDPTVPDWAKQATKPSYTADEVGALPADFAALRYRGTYLNELPYNMSNLYPEDRRVGDFFIHDASHAIGTNEHGAYVWTGNKWESLNRETCSVIHDDLRLVQSYTVPDANAVVTFVNEKLAAYDTEAMALLGEDGESE